METFALWMIICVVCFVHGGRGNYKAPDTCSNSAECTQRNRKCCRDADGDLIDADHGTSGDFIPVPDTNRTGTCSRRKSGARVACNESCGCEKGYRCHRDIQGICCPGMSCWSNKDVKKWNKCLKDNTCALPPQAPPQTPVGPI